MGRYLVDDDDLSDIAIQLYYHAIKDNNTRSEWLGDKISNILKVEPIEYFKMAEDQIKEEKKKNK